MDYIVRGTTPTIKFTFDTTDVQNIVVADLTIKQFSERMVEKNIESAEINTENNTISWTLTQEESLRLNVGRTAFVNCDWKTTGGIRGKSKTGEYQVLTAGKNEVI